MVEHEINGDLSPPHVVNVSFPGVGSEALVMALGSWRITVGLYPCLLVRQVEQFDKLVPASDDETRPLASLSGKSQSLTG